MNELQDGVTENAMPNKEKEWTIRTARLSYGRQDGVSNSVSLKRETCTLE